MRLYFPQNIFQIPLLLFLLCGCGAQEVPGPAEKARFTSYYADRVILSEMSAIAPYDSVTLSDKMDSLMRRHGFTGADIRRMLGFFQDSLPGWEIFLSAVRDTIEFRKNNPPTAE